MRRAIAMLDAATATLAAHLVAPELRTFATAADAETAAATDAPLSLLAFVDADAVAGLRQAVDASLLELNVRLRLPRIPWLGRQILMAHCCTWRRYRAQELYTLGRRECLRLQDVMDAVLERTEGEEESVLRPSPCEDCLYRQQLLCESLADVLDQVDAFVAKLQYDLAR